MEVDTSAVVAGLMEGIAVTGTSGGVDGVSCESMDDPHPHRRIEKNKMIDIFRTITPMIV
jgi:hypothetical protein